MGPYFSKLGDDIEEEALRYTYENSKKYICKGIHCGSICNSKKLETNLKIHQEQAE